MKENDLNELAMMIAEGLRPVAAQRPELAGQLLWLLTQGRAVSPAQVAGALGISPDEAVNILHESPGVELDDNDNVVACFGLSLTPTPHHFRIGDNTLFTWCALDALFLPIALNQAARVESSCAVTGEKILLAVNPDTMQSIEPAGAVLAISVPKASEVCCNVRGAFCDKVHFFSSLESAFVWAAENESATILSVSDAYRLGHLLLKNLF